MQDFAEEARSADAAAVLDYLVAAPRAQTAEELCHRTREVYERYGIVGGIYASIARPGAPVAPRGLLVDGCRDWAEAYIREGCVRDDPAIGRIFANRGPFTWDSLRADGLTAAQARVFAIAADFGIRDGLITPVLGRHGDVSAVIFVSGTRLALDTHETSMLSAVAAAYAMRSAALIGESLAKTTPLSARERQCLAWSARGKSDTLTSQILDLSEKTVRMHVENARRKLGVHTRTQAIVEAWRQGWLVDVA